MQITRHWRMNAQRYRLQGVQYNDDSLSLQARPLMEYVQEEVDENELEVTERNGTKQTVTAA